MIIIANVMDPSYMPGTVLSIFLLYSSQQYYEKGNVSFTSYIIKLKLKKLSSYVITQLSLLGRDLTKWLVDYVSHTR